MENISGVLIVATMDTKGKEVNHINDPEFSEFLLKALDHLLRQKGEY